VERQTADGVEDGADLIDLLFGAADHADELARRRRIRAAADAAVDHRDAVVGSLGAHLQHGVGGNGAHNDGGRARRRAREHPFGALEDGPHLGVVEDHHEDHVATGGERRGCRRHVGPVPEGRGGLLTDVGHRHRQTGADEGRGHAGAHVPEPDDPDPQRDRRPVVLALWHLAPPPDRQSSLADIRRDT
jgi:hypothetical protein